MEPILNEQQQQLHDSAVRLCKDFAGPARLRALQKTGAGADVQAWEQIEQAGWPLLLLPEARGGLGMGMLELSLAMLEGGRNLLLAPVLQACAAVHALGRLPDSAALQTLLERPARLSAVLVDEDDPYSAGLRRPAATEAPGGYQLQGAVVASGVAGADTVFLVPARTAGGESVLVALAAGTPGLTAAPRQLIDGAQSTSLVLDQVAVDAASIVAHGPDADAAEDAIAAILRIGTSAELIGIAVRSLEMTLDHLRTRRQFGKPLASFQALQHQCVNCFLDIELNRSLLYRTSSAWDQGEAHPAMIAALKARTSRAALSATRAAVQLHGAMGYTEGHDIGLYYKRAATLAALYGNENHHAGRFSELTLGRSTPA